MAKREPWNPLLCSYPDSDKINSISYEAETLFTRLIARCDDNANFDGEPALLLCGLFAKRFRDQLIDVTKVERLRDELVSAGLVTLYRNNGAIYIHINKCKKCIRKDLAKDERFPQPTDIKEDTEIVTESIRNRPENGTHRTDQTISEQNRQEHITLVAQMFTDFWKAYPKKTGKGAAEKSFMKIKPSKELFQNMLDAIATQKESSQWKKDGGQYIPNPATWLNQKRWEDEIFNSGMPHERKGTSGIQRKDQGQTADGSGKPGGPERRQSFANQQSSIGTTIEV